MQTRYERLTDPQWEVIKEHLPIQRKRKYDLRDIVNAIFWILRTGSQWRNLPDEYPKWHSVYYYFSKWKKDGTLAGLNSSLNMMLREQEGKEATPSAVSIDSQSIKKAPFICEDTGIDGNKKINGRKRHILTDTMGLVWVVVVHAAHLHDGVMAGRVMEPVLGYLHRLKKVFADMAYKVELGDWLVQMYTSIELEISSRPPSSKGFVPVKIRWVTEQTFGIFNFQRRLDKDHEKTSNSAEAWIYWANCQRILNQLKIKPIENF
jgi:putative transposase